MALIENTMYQPIPTSEYLDGMPNEESLVATRGGWCVVVALEVNHHFKNGGSFWKMINPC